MKTSAIFLSMSLVIASLGGCLSSRDYTPVDDDRFENFDSSFANFTEVDIRFQGARLAGDVGNMRDFDEVATVNGSHDANFTALEVIMQNESGAAMNQLNIYGGIDHEQLAPGARLEFDRESSDYSGDSVYVDGIACAGDGDPYDWSFDQPFESISVDVEEGPTDDSRRLYFTTLSSGQEATGHVDLLILD